MDMNRVWTPFALDAEIETFGSVRICSAHNALREECDRLMEKVKELEHYPNNAVACVSCKKRVNVTALNAIRCDECAKTIPTEMEMSLRAKMKPLVAALQKLRDCDWTISLPDRMDAVRDIAKKALEGL